MQGGTEPHPVYRKMVDLRLLCEQEIRNHRQKADDAAGAFRRALLSIRARAEENIADREKLADTKLYLKELEDDLREALIVKSCKEARHVVTVESLSTAKARTEDLRKTVEKQRSRKVEYESIVSLAMEALNQDNSKDVDTEGTEEAILWYTKVLGFRIEGGEGVKFIFDKIDLENPDKEYSFTIRLNGDTYTLLQCDPSVEDAKVLLNELNQTNGLFKFVRAMRKKFQASADNGILPATSTVHSELSTDSISSPPASADHGRSDFSNLQSDSEAVLRGKKHHSRKEANHGYSARRASQSKSVDALRRSPRRKKSFIIG
ncbi:unnamed protein product [Spirodela intermedia]|uniref:Kinetochore protein SPC25 n=1 Tax=Spirodela intermedia TaxID=51605 RepID=A0A7I8LKH9_SPIIN|nr:unnamed protein product [Spirodela intermedia]